MQKKKKKKRFCSPQTFSQIKSATFPPLQQRFIDHLWKGGTHQEDISTDSVPYVHFHPSLRLSSPFCLFSPFFFPHPHKHTPRKHPNHPASPDTWTQRLVHLCLSLCLLYFHPVCFHSPSFRVITWHLHCKVPFAALSSSAGDWASFPRQIRERERMSGNWDCSGVWCYSGSQNTGTMAWFLCYWLNWLVWWKHINSWSFCM